MAAGGGAPYVCGEVLVESIGSPALWAGFVALVVALLAVDLALHRRPHAVSVREAAVWSAVWIALGLAFGVGVTVWKGADTGLAYFAGYLVEKSLSVDNIFVFVVLFAAFGIPQPLQHGVLFWGVLGALLMRAGMILGAAELLQHFHWAVIPLGIFLVFTGVRMVLAKGEMHPERGRAFRFLTARLPTSEKLDGKRFFTIENGKRLATPLFLALVAIELTDVVFAVDSVPAVFAVTDDPFIVFTSNIFALLGLRSLYFVLSGALVKLRFLKVGLSLVLIFVGSKMALATVLDVSVGVSLAVIAALIGGSIAASLLPRRSRADGGDLGRGAREGGPGARAPQHP